VKTPARWITAPWYDRSGLVAVSQRAQEGDQVGDVSVGARGRVIIVSPIAKPHFVDHTLYDTASILRLIARRFDLTLLPGLAARDAALQAAGKPAIGDLTNALDL
jgi:phospholipase C